MSMQLATLDDEMRGSWKAREKYAAYMKEAKVTGSPEAELLKRAYRELACGRRVIDINQTMRTAGLDALGRPRLAICRANAQYCWFDYNGGLDAVFSDNGSFNPLSALHHVILHLGTFTLAQRTLLTRKRLKAIVPSIPPQFQPKGRNLARYHILWEADWEEVPVDPALLKHLGGSLYAVMAVWDLTPLERVVLGLSVNDRLGTKRSKRKRVR